MNAARLRIIAAVTILVGTTAEAAPPPSLDPGNWGTQPTPEQMERAARIGMDRALKDPESARFRFGRIARVICVPQGLLNRGKPPQYVWSYDFEVNAKNSYGGFTGWKTDLIFLDTQGDMQFYEGALSQSTHPGCREVPEGSSN